MAKNNKKSYWWILGLLLPPVGIVLYFLWRNTRKEESNKIKTSTVVSVVFWVIFGLSFIPGGTVNTVEAVSSNTLKEVDVSAAGKNIQNWYNDLSSGDAVVTVIASSTCQHCQALKPVITASAKKHNYKLYFFEADQLSDDDYLILSNAIDLDGYEGYVPFTFVVKDREFKGSQVGEMKDEELTDFLEQTEVL